MKISALCLSALLFLSAFVSVSAQSFSREGVSFSFPSDWKVTEEENLGDGAYYLSCEKNGSDASGLLTVTWMKGGEMKTVINTYLTNIKKDLTAKGASAFTMEEPGAAVFGSYRGMASSYSFTVGGIPHSGRIYSFLSGGRTFTMIVQEALEDHAKNMEGFAKIEQSFAVK
jgi:hypothetical protein